MGQPRVKAGSFARRTSVLALSRPARLTALAFACLTPLVPTTPVAWGDDRTGAQALAVAQRRMTVSAWGSSVWDAARAGDQVELDRLLRVMQDGSVADADEQLAQIVESYLNHVDKRETDRAASIQEVRVELTRMLAEERTTVTAVKALNEVIELQYLTPPQDKAGILREAPIAELVDWASNAARSAEGTDPIAAAELYVRLDQLHDVTGQYRPDVRRISQRLAMLRLYVPQRLWEMNNARRLASGEKPLPPYNAIGKNFQERLQGVTVGTVELSLLRTRDHVEQVPMADVLSAGLDTLRTMITTEDLRQATGFEGLADNARRDRMLAFLDSEMKALGQRLVPPDNTAVRDLVRRLLERNDQTVMLPTAAILHELGNGAMGKLDEYSTIIWPDEVQRFRKDTEGRFVGIGVHIEQSELQEVRVITPLEGTPAQQRGIHRGDIITRVDGKSVFGLSLDEVVSLITGQPGTLVEITVERPTDAVAGEEEHAQGDEPSKPERQQLVFAVMRQIIEVPSIRGWRRVGAREDAFDWFLDSEARIGYLRMTQFAETTTAELDRAVAQMRREGLRGLVVDLRFNPGGLLDQAVTVAQRLLPVDNQPVVSARRAGDAAPQVEGYTSSARATLASVPVVVLVNEGSASASEIVSGAVRYYSEQHDLDVMVLGWRSFGKGSVQNVWPITANSLLKLTTAYYLLPDDSIIHRRPGSLTWGVQPNLSVEMLPEQVTDAISLRRDADVLPLNENGVIGGQEPPNPDDLLTKGLDLQLEAARLVLRARLAGEGAKVAGDR